MKTNRIPKGLIKRAVKKTVKGFTLIEVMVAMFVVAMAVSALMLKMMSLVDNTLYLDNKTVAHWVAMNQIELQRLTNKKTYNLLKDEKTGQEEMANRTWYWKIKPTKTGKDGFVQLEVSVSDEPESNDPIVTVMALTDRFHIK